jgi:hypothetical protein
MKYTRSFVRAHGDLPVALPAGPPLLQTPALDRENLASSDLGGCAVLYRDMKLRT